jgi:hypothetical protein
MTRLCSFAPTCVQSAATVRPIASTHDDGTDDLEDIWIDESHAEQYRDSDRQRPKTRPEIEGLLLRELQASPDCEQAQAIVVVADDHGIATWTVSAFHPGNANAMARDLALQSIVPRLQRVCPPMGQGTRASYGRCLCAAKLCARRGLPVQLEPRDRSAERRDGDRQGRSCSALSQPDAVCTSLSARDAGDGVPTPMPPGLRPRRRRLSEIALPARARVMRTWAPSIGGLPGRRMV